MNDHRGVKAAVSWGRRREIPPSIGRHLVALGVMKLRSTIMGGWIALALAVPCVAVETADDVQRAIEAFDKEMDAWMEKARNAPVEQRRAIMDERPDPGPTAKRVAEFIEESPKDAEVPAAAAWLLPQRAAEFDRAAVYDVLLEHHLASEGLAEACMAAIYDAGAESREFVETVFEKAGKPQAKGAAAFVLSNRLRRSPGGEEQRAEYLRAAVEHAGDLEFRGRSIKAAAEGELFAAENLAIGKVAPEIEGEDTEGVAFKLSDYRGKVVVIDFWGDW
jgi:hypothetical protein